MSDIALRLDGLILGLAILASGSVFALIALGSALWTLSARPAGSRQWTVPRYAVGFLVAHAVALTALVFFADHWPTTSGPDWLDWLTIPWILFALTGLVLLVSRARRPR